MARVVCLKMECEEGWLEILAGSKITVVPLFVLIRLNMKFGKIRHSSSNYMAGVTDN